MSARTTAPGPRVNGRCPGAPGKTVPLPPEFAGSFPEAPVGFTGLVPPKAIGTPSRPTTIISDPTDLLNLSMFCGKRFGSVTST